MSNIVIVGAQWGDEGKGKIVDYLTVEADYIVRYQGGNNAGHTVVIGDDRYILHLIPSGILHKDKICVIGNGVVIDLADLYSEIKGLESQGISVKGRLFISQYAHLIFPYHKALDKIKEERKGLEKIGTTGRGIGPAYVDKIARTGIRVGDVLDRDVFYKKLEDNLKEKNEIMSKIYGLGSFVTKDIFDEYIQIAGELKEYIADVSWILNEAIDQGKSILFEGAQGTLLDVDHGTYPYVTSSNSTCGGACTGTGVGPTKIEKAMGVVKAYSTRVGEGPLPTEFSPEFGEKIRAKGEEFGATTGRPRRCGWLDAVVTRYAVMINGINALAVTKLDVLDELETIKICTRYECDGKILDRFPNSIDILKRCKPIYEEHPGWKTDTTGLTQYEEFPQELKNYLDRIEELLGANIELVSVGSKRDQTIRISKQCEAKC